MHIAFLTPEFPHPSSTPSGGLGTSIKNLAISLVENNIRVTIFVYGQNQKLRFAENGILFHFVEQKKYRLLGWYKYRKFLQSYINRYVQREKIDLVEAPDWTGITAFMKLACPVVIRMNGSDAYFCKLDGRKQKLKNWFFEYYSLKSADSLISVSRFTAERTREIFKIRREITVIPNSINTSNFKPINLPVIQNRILYFGTLIRKKGFLELPQIFNQVILRNPEVELLLIGRDVIDNIEKISTLELFKKQLSDKAQERTKFIPELSYEKMKEQIAQAAVITLPSFAEALPMTWLEAMAMEKAIVSSNIGWANEVVVDGKTGFSVYPKNHKMYCEKILYLLSNRGEAEKMGAEARRHVEANFSTDVVVLKNINYYKKLLELF